MSAHWVLPTNLSTNNQIANSTAFYQNTRLTNILYNSIGSFGFLLNMFTIVIIYLYKPLHKQITIIFILNQSVMDALASVFLILSTVYPNDYVKRTYGNAADEALCRIWFTALPMWSLLVSSIYGIIALTLERFIAVVYPLWHMAHFTHRKIGAIIIAIWLIGVCYNFPVSISTSGLDEDGVCQIYGSYTSIQTLYLSGIARFIIDFLSPLLFISYFYARMVSTLRRKVSPSLGGARDSNDLHASSSHTDQQTTKKVSYRWRATHSRNTLIDRGVESTELSTQHEPVSVTQDRRPRPGGIIHVQSNGSSVEHGGEELRREPPVLTKECAAAPPAAELLTTVRARRNVIKTFLLCDIGYALCWGWSEIYVLIAHWPTVQAQFNATFFTITIAMEFISCCINPVIYCAQYKQFQRGVKWVFRRRKNTSLH